MGSSAVLYAGVAALVAATPAPFGAEDPPLLAAHLDRVMYSNSSFQVGSTDLQQQLFPSGKGSLRQISREQCVPLVFQADGCVVRLGSARTKDFVCLAITKAVEVHPCVIVLVDAPASCDACKHSLAKDLQARLHIADSSTIAHKDIAFLTSKSAGLIDHLVKAKGNGTRGGHFKIWNFKRWFRLREYMRTNGISRVWTSDADTLWFRSPSLLVTRNGDAVEDADQAGYVFEYDKWGNVVKSSGNAAFVSLPWLIGHTRFILETLRSGKGLVWTSDMHSIKGFVSRQLSSSNRPMVADLYQPCGGHMVDLSLNIVTGWMSAIYKRGPSSVVRKIKQVTFIHGQPYVAPNGSSSLVAASSATWCQHNLTSIAQRVPSL